jgi:hypothetical protein
MKVREGSSGDKRDRRDERSSRDEHPYLTGWKLVIALIVVAGVATVTLCLTGSPEAVVVVVAPLLIIIGVDRYPHERYSR